MSSEQKAEITLRVAQPEDATACGQICYDAFFTINQRHGFPCDFPAPEVAIGLVSMMFSRPDFFCVVAEMEGRIVGSNCLDERSIISGVGPITVDPMVQNRGLGRTLMHAVMERAHAKGAPGVRLVQAAFHSRSLSLYTSLRFDIQEPLACLQGRTDQRSVTGCDVRLAVTADLETCRELSLEVHGFDRTGEMPEAIAQGTAKVVERGGRVTGYTNHLALFGHTTAESNVDVQALIASAESFGGPGILVPSRNTALLRWCLANGLRVVQPMTLMSTGLYNQPRGAWLPSVLF